MASSQALCNDLIRLWSSPSNFIALNPAAVTPTQIDHFFEVQHVVTILFSEHAVLTETNFFKVPVGFFIDLSTSISGHDNLFQISGADNTTKKAITWAQYTPGGNQSQFIQQYMARNTTNNQDRTVGQTVQALAVAMANRIGTYAYLTRFVGQQICKKFNWDDEVLTIQQMQAAGDFTPPWGV